MKLITPIKGIIFDLDGVLIDSEPNYFEADRRVMAEYGVVLTEEMHKEFTGIGNKQMAKFVKEKYKLKDPIEVILRKKDKMYMDLALHNTRVFPQMREFLRLLKEKNLPMAVATGSSRWILDEVMESTKIKSFFNVTISSEEVRDPKPAPDVFIEAAKKINVQAHEALVIEDSQYGVEAALKAGMQCIAIPSYSYDSNDLPEVFYSASLLIKGGMENFDPRDVMALL